jgi:hypothetical protein
MLGLIVLTYSKASTLTSLSSASTLWNFCSVLALAIFQNKGWHFMPKFGCTFSARC